MPKADGRLALIAHRIRCRDDVNPLGLKVIAASDFTDGAARIVSHPEIGVIVMNHSTIAQIPSDDMVRAVKRFRGRYPGVGIFLDSSIDVLETVPVELVAQFTGFIYKLEDTAAFIAGVSLGLIGVRAGARIAARTHERRRRGRERSRAQLRS
ncbi:Orn/Lys/Arg decarboxylase N-terminal domain-containing protein [Paraburkholderia caledonica]|jgi:hypothetical protein|uniref:hypothetical protein n=1 Tax=Paraburkholderia caledonica TaxID=134536 RepID=UPI0038BC5C67